ncbi:uncharacterized protein LOC142324685 [Lycorma delicatula]|uniref:uncharacterized protein LOC142324685 n=1 Tax=Lycorma delicatula TaxID=130591 RepID=UPI003F514499
MSGILFFRREFLSDSIFLKVLNKSLYRNSCFVKRNYSFKSASELKTDYENYVAFKELRNNFREKVIYHSFYKYEDFLLQKKKEIGRSKSEEKNHSRIYLAPASLKYILEDDNRSCLITNEQKDELTKSEETNSVVLPYNVSKVKVSGTDDVNFNNADECNFPENEKESVNCLYKESDVHNLIKDNTKHISNKKWMKDYDIFEEEQDSDEELLEFNKRSEYGTPDSTIPMSNVPCGGCGALLHCQDPGIPGYLPSEIFSSCTVQDLRSITCQRCHFMKNYNTALSVSVDPEYYPRLLSKIKNEEALVILIVDITDFPCSIWPGILNIIGFMRT